MRRFSRVVLVTSNNDVNINVNVIPIFAAIFFVVVALNGQARRIVLCPFSGRTGVESLRARQWKVFVMLRPRFVVTTFLDLGEVPLL